MIRAAIPQDIQFLVPMAEQMHAESPFYRNIPFDRGDMRDFLVKMVGNTDNFCVLVSEVEGRIVGMFAACLCFYYFNQKKCYSGDIGFYVDPPSRGGRHAFALIRAYELWAAERGAWPIRLGESTGINPDVVDVFLKKMGYTASSKSYMKS